MVRTYETGENDGWNSTHEVAEQETQKGPCHIIFGFLHLNRMVVLSNGNWLLSHWVLCFRERIAHRWMRLWISHDWWRGCWNKPWIRPARFRLEARRMHRRRMHRRRISHWYRTVVVRCPLLTTIIISLLSINCWCIWRRCFIFSGMVVFLFAHGFWQNEPGMTSENMFFICTVSLKHKCIDKGSTRSALLDPPSSCTQVMNPS